MINEWGNNKSQWWNIKTMVVPFPLGILAEPEDGRDSVWWTKQKEDRRNGFIESRQWCSLLLFCFLTSDGAAPKRWEDQPKRFRVHLLYISQTGCGLWLQRSSSGENPKRRVLISDIFGLHTIIREWVSLFLLYQGQTLTFGSLEFDNQCSSLPSRLPHSLSFPILPSNHPCSGLITLLL